MCSFINSVYKCLNMRLIFRRTTRVVVAIHPLQFVHSLRAQILEHHQWPCLPLTATLLKTLDSEVHRLSLTWLTMELHYKASNLAFIFSFLFNCRCHSLTVVRNVKSDSESLVFQAFILEMSIWTHKEDNLVGSVLLISFYSAYKLCTGI